MIFDANAPIILLAALLLDGIAGDPDWVWRRLPHPVVWFGSAISLAERQFNRLAWSFATRQACGAVVLAALLACVVFMASAIHAATHGTLIGQCVEAVVVAILLAQKSLYDHVAAVSRGFASGGLPAARAAVSMIVGRDPEALDEPAVSRAAIETLAENFSDGVVAPAFWYLVAGLPGVAAYKLVNTADSMIGHRSERYEAYGWAAARLDDVLNLLPARLSGVLVALGAAAAGGSRIQSALSAMKQDAAKHRSPNAGWPEAAMAGALGVALAGPRRYSGNVVDDHWMNAAGRREASPGDILLALRIYVAACAAHIGLVAVFALLFHSG